MTNSNSVFGNYKRVIKISQMFDVIHNAHVDETVHGGEKKTLSKVSITY